MSKTLYTPQDNADLATGLIVGKPSTGLADTPQEDPTLAYLNSQAKSINQFGKSTTSEQGATVLNSSNSQIFGNIKDIFNKERLSPETKNFFTQGQGKLKFGIDGTIYEPTVMTRLAGQKFEEKYIAQLEKHIFTDKEELDADSLIHFIMLLDLIKKDQYPISITTGKYKKLRNRLITALNTFFKKNYSVLSSIHVMFAGMKNIQPTPTEDVTDV
jgi:hypothetical protein